MSLSSLWAFHHFTLMPSHDDKHVIFADYQQAIISSSLCLICHRLVISFPLLRAICHFAVVSTSSSILSRFHIIINIADAATIIIFMSSFHAAALPLYRYMLCDSIVIIIMPLMLLARYARVDMQAMPSRYRLLMTSCFIYADTLS